MQIIRKVWRGCTNTKTIIFLSIIITLTMISRGFNTDYYNYSNGKSEILNYKRELELHKQIVDKYYEKRRYWKTSNLGTVLFKNIDSKWFSHSERENKTYSILIWRFYDWMKRRHIDNYHEEAPHSELLNACSVKNCVFLSNDSALEFADAVVINTLRGAIPDVKERPPHQRWVFLNDESPKHTFTLTKQKDRPTLDQWANVFNWTMTYRSDSDIPVPYGRTIPLQEPKTIDLQSAEYALRQLVPHWDDKQTEVPIALLASNCITERLKFYDSLLKYVAVDIYGGCSADHRKSCPGHIRADCPIMNKYLFYLVYENSKCRQYLTEKAFYHGYLKGGIPIIVGPPKSDCEKLLPTDSFIHIEDYGTPENLAEKIKSILLAEDKNEQLLSYHKWRIHFEAVNEHGYFGTKSFHYCRVCEALNYNDEGVSIYDKNDLKIFFDSSLSCES